jgi:hypothetical protein
MDASTARTRNIRALVAQHEGPSKFAALVGRDQAQVSQWISTTHPKPIGSRLARHIEQATGKPLGWLDSAQHKNLAAEPNSHVRGAHIRFELLEGFTSHASERTETAPFIEVSQAWAKEKLHGVPAESIRIITGRGDSMRGTYDDGDILFIDTRVKTFVADAAYVFRYDGMVLIKRLQWIGNGTVQILSENSRYPPTEARLGDLEIGGRALAVLAFGEF